MLSQIQLASAQIETTADETNRRQTNSEIDLRIKVIGRLLEYDVSRGPRIIHNGCFDSQGWSNYFL